MFDDYIATIPAKEETASATPDSTTPSKPEADSECCVKCGNSATAIRRTERMEMMRKWIRARHRWVWKNQLDAWWNWRTNVTSRPASDMGMTRMTRCVLQIEKDNHLGDKPRKLKKLKKQIKQLVQPSFMR